MLRSRKKYFAVAATLVAFATVGTAPVYARMAGHRMHHAKAFNGKGLYDFAGSAALTKGQDRTNRPAATGGGNIDFNNKTHTTRY
jgi:hypothetical protein